MQGLLTFLDPPRPDTKETVRLSRENGVAVKMITGDHLLIALETSRVLNMGGNGSFQYMLGNVELVVISSDASFYPYFKCFIEHR